MVVRRYWIVERDGPALEENRMDDPAALTTRAPGWLRKPREAA